MFVRAFVYTLLYKTMCVCVCACTGVLCKGVWCVGGWGKVCPPCLLAVVLHSTAVAEPGSHKTTLAMKTAHFFTIAGHLCGFC